MLVNGLPQHTLELSDRALHYGDGAFETLRVENRRPVHWSRHLLRLNKTCDFLKIPLDNKSLVNDVQAILQNTDEPCILKIIVSRGSGGRGYRPPESCHPTRILSLHTLPADYSDLQQSGIRLMRCLHPVSENPALAGIKHLNRLDQVLASMELPADCHEGVMLTSTGKVIEGTRSNIFLVRHGRLLTPALEQAGVAGIQRQIILERCKERGIDIEVRDIHVAELNEAQELFVCNSVLGIWPVVEWRDGDERRHLLPGQITRRLQDLTRSAD